MLLNSSHLLAPSPAQTTIMLVRKRIPLLPLGCQRVPTKGKEGSPRIEFLHIMLNCVVNLLLPFIFHVLVFLALCTK